VSALSARPVGRGASWREKGNRSVYGAKAPNPAEEDRPIDPMSGKKYARLE
jgi:hypothetical protein